MIYNTGKDFAVLESDIPQMSPGAPLPVVIGDEHRLLIMYYIEKTDGNADELVILRFIQPMSFGHIPISDEIFTAHPLHSRGLHSYTAVTVQESSWLAQLRAWEYHHDRPAPWTFDNCKHFVFAFHDSVFECIANGYAVTKLSCVYSEALERLFAEFKAASPYA